MKVTIWKLCSSLEYFGTSNYNSMTDLNPDLNLGFHLTLYLTSVYCEEPFSILHVWERMDGQSSCFLLSTSSPWQVKCVRFNWWEISTAFTWPVTMRQWRRRQSLKVRPSCLNSGWGDDRGDSDAGSRNENSFNQEGNSTKFSAKKRTLNSSIKWVWWGLLCHML